MQYLSIIVPTFNESLSIENTLISLTSFVQEGHELIIVDGGSEDNTVSICKRYTDKVFISTKGRSSQMNFGANESCNNTLVFLHADTLLPCNAAHLITNSLIDTNTKWGHFRVRLNGRKPILRVIEFFMNTRSCITGIATGDQVIFIRKCLFDKIGGYKDIPLMEDIEISKSLNKYSKPICLKSYVISSSRRWEANGYFKTIILMWKLRFLYFFGVPADKLVKLYY